MTECIVSLTLLDGAELESRRAGDGEAVGEGELLLLHTPAAAHRPRLTFKQPGPGLTDALRQLLDGGASVPYLIGSMMQREGPAGVGRLQACLARLHRWALLNYHLAQDGQRLLTLRPLSEYFRYQENRADAEHRYRLSRFACLRAAGIGAADADISHGARAGGWRVESPLAHADLTLHMPLAIQALDRLTSADACDAAALAQAVPGLGAETALRLLDLCANAALLVDADRPDPERESEQLAQWDFHDLLFHSRSRLGRHANPYGGTYPFKDRFAAPPVVKPPNGAPRIALHRPGTDAPELQRRFFEVLDSRASIREQGDPPIALDQLGTFLWYSARIKKLAAEAGVSFRPHPGGGALHELDIYPLVTRCEGLEPGLYHYRPDSHELETVSDMNEALQTLAQLSAITATLQQPPQVVLILAARFQRIQNKYQSMSYAVILKHVGVMYQTFYLVANALGLAPCALGGGHSDLFSQAAGLDYCSETSVGEFILGSRASPSVGPGGAAEAVSS